MDVMKKNDHPDPGLKPDTEVTKKDRDPGLIPAVDDEDLARLLQMEEEQEYEERQKAAEKDARAAETGDEHLAKLLQMEEEEHYRQLRRAGQSNDPASEANDEELARQIQMEEEKEYQEYLGARRQQLASDHNLAKVLSENPNLFEGSMEDDGIIQSMEVPQQRILPPDSAASTSATATATADDPVLRCCKTCRHVSAGLVNETVSDCETDFLKNLSEVERTVERQVCEAEVDADAELAAETAAREHELNEDLGRVFASDLSDTDASFGDESAHFLTTMSSSSSSATVGRSRSSRSSSSSELCLDDTSDDSQSPSYSGYLSSPSTNKAGTFISIDINVVRNGSSSAVMVSSGVPRRGLQAVNPRFLISCDDSQPVHMDCVQGDPEKEEEEEEEEESEAGEEEEEIEENSYYGDYENIDDESQDLDDLALNSFEDVDDNGVDDDDDDDIGLSQTEINMLPTRTFRMLMSHPDAGSSSEQSPDKKECQVCWSDFADGDVLRILPCCHQFHAHCVDVWLRKSNVCPLCRLKLSAEMFQ